LDGVRCDEARPNRAGEAAGTENPRLANLFADDASAAYAPFTNAKFHAENLAAPDPVRESVNVGVYPHGPFPSSLQEFDTVTREDRPRDAVVSASTVTVGGQTAYRSQVESGPEKQRTVLGVLVLRRGSDTVDLSALVPADNGSGAKLVDQILSSVRRL
jgi:hypothetical protein